MTRRPDHATRPSEAMPPETAVALRHGQLAYDGRILFDGLSFDLTAGQWTCLLGPSGGGKSSLLRLIAGLPTGGAADVAFQGADRPAYMAQQDLLLPWLDVTGNVTLGTRLRGEVPDPARAAELIGRVGLTQRADAFPAALSGGERQRAALARTLMEDRPVVLMDEPFSALDALTRHTMQDLAAQLLENRTVLLVTHDPMEALRLGDRICILSGEPATIADADVPPGARPRAAAAPELTAYYGDLLARLGAAPPPGAAGHAGQAAA